MDHLIIGMGEIGTAINALFPDAQTLDRQLTDINIPIHVMHIAFPYTGKFVKQVREYQIKYQPDHTIVYSTVPIGTCEKIGPGIVHSPIEGRHPNLEASVRKMHRWLGSDEPSQGQFFSSLFRGVGIRSRLVDSSQFTEALKLLSTTEYGVNLAYADYKQRVADEIGMPLEYLKDWNVDYNRLYRDLGEGNRFQKFVLDPPGGKIGGHCIRPNCEILDKQFPHEFVTIVKEMR